MVLYWNSTRLSRRAKRATLLTASERTARLQRTSDQDLPAQPVRRVSIPKPDGGERHRESTERQYALQELARNLGGPIARISVLDGDLGKSGTSTTDREGFKTLVADVSLGKAGTVLAIEASRLARSNADWLSFGARNSTSRLHFKRYQFGTGTCGG
ncbi:recombinase family protein [Novipirellula herctigrandis]|uniref:recombinase family protein n=1 Tax=Novipirellula herctigrandis TaxID=2527986 RepID=UPI003AF3C3CC